jgi:hypothetical protein
MTSLFGRAQPPGPTVEQQVKETVDKNEETLSELQARRDEQAEIIRQLGENVKRLAASGHKAQAERTFREMKRKEKALALLDGKIESISVVNEGVHDMHSNVAVHSAITRANAASTRIAGTLKVEDVQESMEAARNHMDDHADVSRALAGESLLEPQDEDEMRDEMAAFLGTSSSSNNNGVRRPATTQAQRQAQDETLVSALDSLPRAPTGAPMTKEQRAAAAAKNKTTADRRPV